MNKTFEELNKAYAGMEMQDDYEEVVQRILESHGLKLELGDHQLMIPIVSRSHAGLNEKAISEAGSHPENPASEYSAWACICFDEGQPGNRILDVHLEHGPAACPDADAMTEEECRCGIALTEEVLLAVTVK